MTYRLHGLTFRSEIDLPHWPAGNGSCDASIRVGEVPSELPDARQVGAVFAGRTGICLLTYSHIGPILIASGREIVVSGAATSPEWLRTVLSGTAVALLLHQRGRLCLHASSVVKDGRAFLVAGASGSGKSTTAAALAERGATLLADDITTIDTASDGTILAYPGLQTLRLRSDSVAALPAHAQKPKSRGVDPEKQLIASPGADPDTAFPVASINFLRRASDSAPTAFPIHGSARIASIEKNLFRPRMARIVADPRQRFEACTRLATRVPLREIVRPENGFHLDQLCACVLQSVAN